MAVAYDVLVLQPFGRSLVPTARYSGTPDPLHLQNKAWNVVIVSV